MLTIRLTGYLSSDEAFEKANKENKPVFLSIGTCHWCRVDQGTIKKKNGAD
jgi:uncharacterized protein YyaL (SSP411 family)